MPRTDLQPRIGRKLKKTGVETEIMIGDRTVPSRLHRSITDAPLRSSSQRQKFCAREPPPSATDGDLTEATAARVALPFPQRKCKHLLEGQKAHSIFRRFDRGTTMTVRRSSVIQIPCHRLTIISAVTLEYRHRQRLQIF